MDTHEAPKGLHRRTINLYFYYAFQYLYSPSMEGVAPVRNEPLFSLRVFDMDIHQVLKGLNRRTINIYFYCLFLTLTLTKYRKGCMRPKSIFEKLIPFQYICSPFAEKVAFFKLKSRITGHRAREIGTLKHSLLGK